MFDPDREFIEHIRRKLRYAPEAVGPGSEVRFPTCDRPSDRSGWARMAPDGRAGWFRDHRTGNDGYWMAPRRFQNSDWRTRQPSPEEDLRKSAWERDRWMRIWSEAIPISIDSPAGLYLAHRGLTGWEALMSPDALRTTRLEYWQDGRRVGVYHALLARVQSPTGETVAFHRTYLAEDGTKATVAEPKKLTRRFGNLAGAAVRLMRPSSDPNRVSLGVAEGIETAIAAALLHGVPTWAALCAHGLKTILFDETITDCHVFADNDRSGVGQQAAQCLVDAHKPGRDVRIWLPEDPGSDWADVNHLQRSQGDVA